MGVIPEEYPEKPDAMVRYEQCRAMGVPMVNGGLVDQPHIWLAEYGVCLEQSRLFEETQRSMNSARENK